MFFDRNNWIKSRVEWRSESSSSLKYNPLAGRATSAAPESRPSRASNRADDNSSEPRSVGRTAVSQLFSNWARSPFNSSGRLPLSPIAADDDSLFFALAGTDTLSCRSLSRSIRRPLEHVEMPHVEY